MRSLICFLAAFAVLFAVTTPPGHADTRISATEQRAIDACRAWWHPLDINAEATAMANADGLCVSGFVDSGRDKAILSELAELPRDGAPVVVIRSGGGEFMASMTVAEALLARKATVIGDTLCASACANYILAAGARRIVLPDSFLLFHGGMTMDLMAQAEPQVGELMKADPRIRHDEARATLKAELDASIARQNALMVKAGINPEIFEWMGRANTMSGEEIARNCPADTHVIQYRRDRLQGFGYRFDLYDAPATQAETDALLRKLGRESKVCFWAEPS
jgi:ATP-dependent protease ClpP protease subunit